MQANRRGVHDKMNTKENARQQCGRYDKYQDVALIISSQHILMAEHLNLFLCELQ